MAGSCPAGCSAHHCHAWGCREHVPPRMLMCRGHWFMVPLRLRRAVWTHYRPGQERDKRPSKEYIVAAIQAIAAVAGRARPDEGEQGQLALQLGVAHGG